MANKEKKQNVVEFAPFAFFEDAGYCSDVITFASPLSAASQPIKHSEFHLRAMFRRDAAAATGRASIPSLALST